MVISSIRKLFILSIVIAVTAYPQSGGRPADVERRQHSLIKALETGDTTSLEQTLLPGFRFSSGTENLDRAAFVSRVRASNPRNMAIRLKHIKTRVTGDEAVSEGDAVISIIRPDRTSGESVKATNSAVGTMSGTPPPDNTSGSSRAVPAPMPIPGDLPVPFGAGTYRFRAVYKWRGGQWQLSSLRATRQ
jgi:hypothetical protein